VRALDKNQIYQQGIALKRQKKYEDAIRSFEKVDSLNDGELDVDLLFNLGICYWRLGNLGQAVECLEKVLKFDPFDLDTKNILQKIRRDYPHQVVDFRKDGVILDANFVIDFCNKDFRHLPRFLSKARKKFNFYTSLNVYVEMIQIDSGAIPYSIQDLQQLLKENLIINTVTPNEIEKLEAMLFSEFDATPEIKARHMGRPHAWKNDLSLICLLHQIQNPIRYIVTNDQGISQIIHFIYANKDPHYYFRPNELFMACVNQFCITASRAFWEKQIYNDIVS